MSIRSQISVFTAATVVATSLAWSASASAAPVKILGTGSDRANFSGATVTGLTLSGVSYTPDQFLHINLTGFTGNGSNASLLFETGSTTTTSNLASPPSTATRRGFLETDNLVNTGIINVGAGTNAMTASFSGPLQNRPGADLVIMEIAMGSPADSFYIKINGTETEITNANYGDTTANSGVTGNGPETVAVWNTTNNAVQSSPTLAQITTSSTLRIGTANIAQDVFGVGLDLSDFGVPLNGWVSSFALRSKDTGNAFDPVFIVGVPEPTTAAALGIVGSALLLARRRRAAAATR